MVVGQGPQVMGRGRCGVGLGEAAGEGEEGEGELEEDGGGRSETCCRRKRTIGPVRGAVRLRVESHLFPESQYPQMNEGECVLSRASSSLHFSHRLQSALSRLSSSADFSPSSCCCIIAP